VTGVGGAATSAAQDRLWFLNGLFPGSPALSHCLGWRIEGPLDLVALRRAWQAVLQRHPILRTTLVEVAGRPVARTRPDGEPLRFADFSAVAGPDRCGRADRWCAELAAARFDLAAGPLARLGVARLDPRDHLLVLSVHRAVADDRSVAELVRELSIGYATARSGAPAGSALPPPAGRYRDYAGWQRDWQGSRAYADQLDWWQARLTPPPPPLRLPGDRPDRAARAARAVRPPVPGGTVEFDWGRPAGRALAGFAAGTGTSPFLTLLAGFLVLLGRYGDRERVAVAVPASVRPRPEFDRLVGPCDNLLVLGADLTARPSFRTVLARLAVATRDAYHRRGVPFHQVVAAGLAEPAPGRLPLAPAGFDFPEQPPPVPAFPAAVAHRHPVHHGSATADLTLTVHGTAPSVTGRLEYRADRFAAESAGRIAGQLHTLLAAALTDPDRPVAGLPLDTGAQLRRRVREADRTTAGPAPRAPVQQLVRNRAGQQPGALAVAWDGDCLSYRELCRRAGRIRDRVRRLGPVAGSPVAVRIAPGPDQVAALLAVLDAGAYLLCLGSGRTGERDRAILTEQRPVCLLVAGETGADELAGWFRAELGGPVLDVRDRGLAGLPDRGLADLPDRGLAELRDRGVPAGPSAPAELRGRAYVAYTSGSTGRPKGIVQRHATLTQFATWFAGEFGIRPGARVAQWAAANYDASLGEVCSALVAGATLCPVPERVRSHPERLVDWLARERITVFQTVPSFARELSRVLAGGRPPGGLPELACLLLAGEALAGELANQLRAALPGARLVNLYGPTESILATWQEVTGEASGTVPLGHPIPGRQVLVLDERDRPCPAGVPGGLAIVSPYLCDGYIGAGASEVAAFRPLPGQPEYGIRPVACYRTGDVGRWRWDGALEFLGRKDFQVKFAGVRVELTEVEAALGADGTVLECAVVAARGADRLVRRLVAYVVPRPGGDGSPRRWRASLRRRYGGIRLPVSFQVLDGLPRNSGGKVDRARLATWIESTVGPAGAGLPTNDEVNA
jgi:amino acid adenylation domain-containing protein